MYPGAIYVLNPNFKKKERKFNISLFQKERLINLKKKEKEKREKNQKVGLVIIFQGKEIKEKGEAKLFLLEVK